MKTNIHERINESDRAVSPVIGVILMVAITVILAAVIGTFVLGLGSDLNQNAPSATMTIQDHSDSLSATNAQDGDNLFQIDHSSGNEIPGDELRILIRNDSTGDTLDEWQDSWSNGNTVEEFNGDESGLTTDSFISTGDRIVLKYDDSGSDQYTENVRYEITLVHIPTDQTIASSTVQLR